MNILSVETSCDETSVAITQDGTRVLSNVVLSQIKTHALYGGVVPEIASREHVEGITRVFDQAIAEAGIPKEAIDLVAVTQGPGLIGSLLVGINAAKAFAYAHDIPIIGVHHIVGHIYANATKQPLEFPLLALIISGGHTELIYMPEHMRFERLGKTQDDAIGEAYDKVARLLDLGYPGGPKLDQLAQEGTPSIPMPNVALEGYDLVTVASNLTSLIHCIIGGNDAKRLNLAMWPAVFKPPPLNKSLHRRKKPLKPTIPNSL